MSTYNYPKFYVLSTFIPQSVLNGLTDEVSHFDFGVLLTYGKGDTSVAPPEANTETDPDKNT